jgi:hypothetical protein
VWVRSTRPSLQEAEQFGLGSPQEIGASPSPQVRTGDDAPKISTAASTEAF